MADKTLEIKITADDKELEKSLSSVEKSIKDFAKQSAKASIDVDTASALKKIEAVEKKLKELEGNKKSRFDFVYGKSIQTINSVLDKLAKLDKYKNIKVGLDLASNVNKELAKLDKIKSKNVNISINTKGIEDATKKLNGLYKVLSKIRKANKVIINTQIKDVGKLPKQALNNGSQSVKAQEASLMQIAKNYAGLAEQAWMDGDLKSFSQYRDMFRVAMNDLVNFKRALGDLSVGGEKTVYSNMARSLKDTSPLYHDIIKKVSQLDSEQKKFNDDVRNVGNAKQQYKTLSTALREVTKEAERAWSVGDKKGFGIAKSQFNDISSLMTQLRKELGTLTVEQEIRSYEKMLRGMSATNPWLAVLKSKLEELYKEKAELDKIKNEIKAKLAPEQTPSAPSAPRSKADYAKALTALQQNVVARAEDYNKAFGTPEAEKARKAYEGALTALLKFKQQQQGMLSYSSQKAVYNSVAPKIQKDSQAYELLRKKIQEATNATKELNSSQGDKGALFGNTAQKANYWVGFLGRSSKGFGSFGEALSFFLTRLSQATGTLGAFAKGASVVVATLATLIAGFYMWGKAVSIAVDILQQLGQAVLTALQPGYEVFVQSTKGILSLSAALRTMGNYQGQVVTKSQAMAASVNLMNQALYRAQQSAFSYQEVVQALQGVLPLVLGKGMNAQQALDITTGVAGVAKLTGLNQNQILQETRDLMQGTITARTSQVANALGISNEDLAQYKANSDELFKFLMDKFKNYSEVLSEYANTVPGSIEQLQETIGIAGQLIIDKFGGEIVSVVKTLTNLLVEFTDANGTVVDSNGKILASSKKYTDALGNQQSVVGLTIDSNKDLVDSLGNVVVKAEEVAEQGLGLDAETTRAQMTEPLKEVVAVLQDVADYALYSAYSFVEWLKAEGYISDTGDTLDTVGEILKTLIDLVISSVEWWITFADTLNTINNLTLRPLYLTLKAIANLIKTIVTSSSKLFVGDIEGARKDWDSFKDTLFNDFGKLGADLFFGKDKKKAISDYLSNGIARAKTDAFKKDLLSSTKDYKSLSDWYKFAEEKGVKPSSIAGNQKQNEKANKEALKQAQKAFDAQKEELKNALEDIKEIISKQMESLDTMFEQGLMTAESYYAKKIELETQQAQADVDYYNKLIELTNKRPYEYDEDRQKELLKLNRELAKAVAKLEDIGLTQKELVKLTRESSEIAYAMNQLGKPSSDLATQQLSSYSQSSGQFSGLSNSDIDYLVRKSVEYGVDSRLVAALISAESGGNQSAVSPAGAIGVGQLMPETAKELGVNPYDKLQNIEGTIKYLAQMLQRFGGDVSKALAAYNAGAGAVEAYNGVPPYSDTQAYVNNVMSTYQGMANFGVIDTRVVEYGNKAQSQLGGYIVQAGEPNYLEGGFDSRYIGKWESMAGATDLEGVQDFVVSAFNMAVNEYMGATGQKNKIVITGGAEQGSHAGGTYSHGAGYKLDIDHDSIKYIEQFLDIFSKYGFAIGDEGSHYDLSAAGTGTGGDRLATPKTPLINRLGDIKNYSDVAQKEALKIKQAFEKQQEEMLSIMQEWQKLFSGGYDAQRVAITRKYNKQIHEYEQKILETKDKNLQDELTQTKQRLIDIRDFKLADIDYSEIKEKLEYQFKDLSRSISYLGAKLASGLGDVAHGIVTGAQAVGKYFENYFGVDSPINAELNSLVEQAALAQKQGSIGEYWQRQESIDNIFKNYASNINTALDAIDATYKHRIDMLDYSGMSNMQIEERKSILKSLEAQSKVDIYTEQLNSYIQKRNEFQAKIDELAKSDREDKEQLIAVWQTLVDKINHEYIPATERAIELNSKIADTVTLLDKVRKTAKDSLEEGLVEFLTDGINACESLGEAFRNLVVGILKEMQKLFAKEMVTGLMDMWFGKKEDKADVNRLGNKAKPYDDESYTIRSVDYNAWYRQQNPPSYNPLADISWQTKDKNWLNQPQDNNKFDFSMSQLDSQFGYTGQNLNQLNSALQQATQSFNMNSQSVDKSSQSSEQSIQTVAPIEQTISQVSTAIQSELVPAISSASSALNNLTSSLAQPTGHATGGYISGKGTGTSDSIPAMLSNGEFVIKASSVKKYGTNFLNAVNSGSFSRIPVRMPKFAGGGIVNEGIENTARGMTDFAKNIGTNVSTTNKINLALVRNEDEAMEHFMRSGAGQRAMLDFTRRNASFIGKITRSY
ncbi:MAG: transglycosylase SLT domain-containing protein [Cellulosilyticum sp.]|nr:transglycosylase SLT domain-containing protein [Cellulosilyticum sp.]